MANSYVFPGNNSVYVPSLSLDLMVEFNRTDFPINRYIGKKKVDKESGLYTTMKNDNQARFVNAQEFIWADGNDAPKVLGTGTDSFTFTPYSTQRYAYVEQLGYLAVEQAAWDLMGQAARLRTMQGMTARSKRVANALTLSTNFPTTNYAATAGALTGGGPWATSSAANQYIKHSVLAMQQAICLNTLGVVQPKDLYLVINPNTAIAVASAPEIVDLIKQSPVAMSFLEGTQFNGMWGLPNSLYGVNLVVDDSVYNNTLPGQAPTLAYTIGDNVAFMVTKQNAVQPSSGQAFSTFELLMYSDWEVYVYNDVKNRRYDLQVVENTAEQIFSGASGFLCASVAS